MDSKTLADVIKDVRVSVVANACGLTPRAIYKWVRIGCLPRTDYTGETDYAEKIAKASGGKFSAELIRNISKPKQPLIPN